MEVQSQNPIDEGRKLYKLGYQLLIIAGIGLFAVFLTPVLPTNITSNQLSWQIYGSILSGLFLVACLCYTIALLQDILLYLDNIATKIAFKLVAGGSLWIITNISFILSRDLVNYYTYVDTSHLPVSLSIFTSILVLLISFVVALSLTFIVWLLNMAEIFLSFFLGFFSIRTVSIWQKFTIDPDRKIAVGATFSILVLVLVLSIYFWDNHESLQSKIISTVIVRSNYHQYNEECNNHHRGEWTSVIGVKKISVAIPDDIKGYRFEVRKCDLTPLPPI